MKPTVIFCIALICISFTFNRGMNHEEELKDSYYWIDEYVPREVVMCISIWPNGKRKAEGGMCNGMRTGDWKLWDSTGKLLMVREYTNGFTWKQTFPAEKPQRTSYAWIDTVKGNYFAYRKIKPDSVIHSRRVWRYAPYDKWNPVFMNNAVLDTLIEMRLRGEIAIGDDDQMITLLSMGEFGQRLESSDNKILLGYRLKEDWYYDYKKQSGIFALVSLCPVLKGTDGDSIDLGWIMFDDAVQAKLASMSFVPRYQSSYPETYHEMFFQRCYTSTVYKYTNIRNKTLAELFPDPVQRQMEQQQVEREHFEWEHDHWIDYYVQPQIKKSGK